MARVPLRLLCVVMDATGLEDAKLTTSPSKTRKQKKRKQEIPPTLVTRSPPALPLSAGINPLPIPLDVLATLPIEDCKKVLFGYDTGPSLMLRKVRTAQPEDSLGLLAFSQYFGYIPGKRNEMSPQERAGMVLAYQRGFEQPFT